jgi:HSP20 family protein
MKEKTMALPVRRTTTPTSLTERWNPFRDLDDLHARMEQRMQGVRSEAPTGDAVMWAPAADTEETEDAWIVEADLPGVDRKDVNVEMRGSELTISGQVKERERTGIVRRRTRRKGRFEYRVTIPGEADAEGTEASLHDGLLAVRIPKSERAKPRRIAVKSG